MEPPLIFIVEDDEKSRRLMSDVLAHQGYRIVSFDNAEAAIAQMRLDHPDLLLMDIHLPGMSGLDALRTIRADSSIQRTRIVAVTASVMGNDRDRIRAAGFDAFEPKPVNLRAFLQTIANLLAPSN